MKHKHKRDDIINYNQKNLYITCVNYIYIALKDLKNIYNIREH